MIVPPPLSTRTETLFPSTTLVRSTSSPSPSDQPQGGTVDGPSQWCRRPLHDPLRPRGHQPLRELAHQTVVQRSEEHTSELQSLMRTSSAVFCLITKTSIHTRS